MMLRCLLALFLSRFRPSRRPHGKDELVVAMTQYPGTWNPLIS